jgi:hypothetical protein
LLAAREPMLDPRRAGAGRRTDRSGLQLVTRKQRSPGGRGGQLRKMPWRARVTRRALPADMYDADAIEAINFEQLVTATDRLLLRAGRAGRRPSVPSLATGAARQLRGTQPSTPRGTRRAPRTVPPSCEQTAFVRTDRAARSSVFAVTVAIPALAALAFTLAALL